MSVENTQTAQQETDLGVEQVNIEEGAPAGVNEEATLEADVQGFAGDVQYEERIAALEAELEETKSKWMRAVAEEQNVRRRAEREKQDALKYGVTNFAREMVSVADNLRRALSSAPQELKDSDLLKGVEMTERELQNAFNKAGIKRVDAEGQPFDHNVHQAVFEINDPTQPAGLVGQVMQDGYVIHDRLLRPAMVGVTKGGPKYEPTAEPQDEVAGQESQTATAASDAYEAAGAEPGEKINQES